MLETSFFEGKDENFWKRYAQRHLAAHNTESCCWDSGLGSRSQMRQPSILPSDPWIGLLFTSWTFWFRTGGCLKSAGAGGLLFLLLGFLSWQQACSAVLQRYSRVQV